MITSNNLLLIEKYCGPTFPIIKSQSDKRVYHGFQLSNKLKVAVISDPTTLKAAASMDVHIGI